MAKYYGEWSSGSTFTAKPYESNNKNELIKLMTKCAYDNCAGMEQCHWSVWKLDGHNRVMIAEGGKGYGGRKWRENYYNQ